MNTPAPALLESSAPRQDAVQWRAWQGQESSTLRVGDPGMTKLAGMGLGAKCAWGQRHQMHRDSESGDWGSGLSCLGLTV